MRKVLYTLVVTILLSGSTLHAQVTNFLSKYTSTGELTASSLFESSGNWFSVGTTTPSCFFDLRRSDSVDVMMRVFNTGISGAKMRVVSNDNASGQFQFGTHSAYLASIAANLTDGFEFRLVPSGSGSSEGDLDTSTRMVIRRNGNVGIGTESPSSMLHVAGDVTVDGNIGAKYQDLAEWVPATAPMDAGTVVVLNPDAVNEVMPSSRSYDSAVAGVVSAMPGVILGEPGPSKAQIATTGRVRVRVDATAAPIRVGDLLVTGTKPGTAMKSLPVDIGGVAMHRPGTVVGKALEPLAGGTGEILVLLSLQ